MFDDALLMAKERDKELREGKKRGILHGIPMSLKDSFKFKESIATSGCASYVNKMSFENGVLANVFVEFGAIPFVKSNVP